jgi:hypothetical protein
MENLVFLAPFIPFLAMVPPSLAAMWIASRWLKARHADAQLVSEVAALRDELSAIHNEQVDMQERLDLAERMLSQVRSVRELPKLSP